MRCVDQKKKLNKISMFWSFKEIERKSSLSRVSHHKVNVNPGELNLLGVCVCIFLCACTCVCVGIHVCGGQSVFLHLFHHSFFRQDLSLNLELSNWLWSPRDPPVSASPVLELQACAALASFLGGCLSIVDTNSVPHACRQALSHLHWVFPSPVLRFLWWHFLFRRQHGRDTRRS